jgi:hypothetical protein
MTINEIKETLGVDLTLQNRTVVNTVLKALYVEQQYKQLKHLKQAEILRSVTNDINCKRSNIYNYFKKMKTYKTDKASKLIVKAYVNKDKEYIKKYYDLIQQQKDSYKQQWSFKKYYDGKDYEPKRKVNIPTRTKVNKLMSNLQVADYLKANKVLKKTKFWDKMLLDYTAEDWNKLRNINPEMFDSYLK